MTVSPASNLLWSEGIPAGRKRWCAEEAFGAGRDLYAVEGDDHAGDPFLTGVVAAIPILIHEEMALNPALDREGGGHREAALEAYSPVVIGCPGEVVDGDALEEAEP